MTETAKAWIKFSLDCLWISIWVFLVGYALGFYSASDWFNIVMIWIVSKFLVQWFDLE